MREIKAIYSKGHMDGESWKVGQSLYIDFDKKIKGTITKILLDCDEHGQYFEVFVDDEKNQVIFDCPMKVVYYHSKELEGQSCT